MSAAPRDNKVTAFSAVDFGRERVLRPGHAPWQQAAFRIIFEHHTRGGLIFDGVLLVIICLSTLAVMLETVQSVQSRHGTLLYAIEWIATGLFTVEYIVRIACLRTRWRYVFSFFGVVDLVSILPTYASLFLLNAQSLAVIRALRLLRVFRVFKLARFIREGAELRASLWAARAKIVVFLMTVLIVTTIIGSAMYLVEGRVNKEQYGSIPDSIYWAIVTIATVGYGDIAPITPMGKFLTAILIVFGYSLIVVPTGIITAEISSQKASAATGENLEFKPRLCGNCGHEEDDVVARYCKYCGGVLEPPVTI